jgi:hypothetical protein
MLDFFFGTEKCTQNILLICKSKMLLSCFIGRTFTILENKELSFLLWHSRCGFSLWHPKSVLYSVAWYYSETKLFPRNPRKGPHLIPGTCVCYLCGKGALTDITLGRIFQWSTLIMWVLKRWELCLAGSRERHLNHQSLASELWAAPLLPLLLGCRGHVRTRENC